MISRDVSAARWKEEFPHLSLECCDLMEQLLCNDPRKRIGVKHGAADILRHKWFKNFRLEELLRQQLNSPFREHCERANTLLLNQ